MSLTSTFVKGSSTYSCSCCGRLTRFTGEQSVGSRTCPQCWDLAGYENEVQDGCFGDASAASVASLFAVLDSKGAQYGAAARASFDLLADHPAVAAALAASADVEAPAAAEPAAFAYASKEALAAMGPEERAAYRRARRAAARARRSK